MTEVRPTLVPDLIDPDMPATAGGPAPAADILLARIDLTIPAQGAPVLDDIAVDNTTRPYLLHTQLIQELFDIPDLAGRGGRRTGQRTRRVGVHRGCQPTRRCRCGSTSART